MPASLRMPSSTALTGFILYVPLSQEVNARLDALAAKQVSQLPTST